MNNTSECKRPPVGHIIQWTIVGLLMASTFILVLGVLVQYLWNNTISEIFSISTISYWQAVGILFLCKLLFGGFCHSKGKQKMHAMKEKFHKKRKFPHMEHMRRIHNMEHYNEFWEEEGRDALQAYIDKKNGEQND